MNIIEFEAGYIKINIYDKYGDSEDMIFTSTDGVIFTTVPAMDNMVTEHYYGIQYLLSELTHHTNYRWQVANKGKDDIFKVIKRNKL